MLVDSMRKVLADESRGPLRLKRTVDAATEPVTTANMKAHLRVESTVTADDTYIDALVQAARIYVEEVTGRSLITQTWEYSFDRWYRWQIEIPRAAPLQSITSIEYYDTADVLQTLSATTYDVDTAAEPGNVRPVFGSVWPSTYFKMGAIKITFVAGYGSAAANVPATLVHAIKLLVGHWYENRASVEVNAGALKAIEVPSAFWALVRPYEARVLL